MMAVEYSVIKDKKRVEEISEKDRKDYEYIFPVSLLNHDDVAC